MFFRIYVEDSHRVNSNSGYSARVSEGERRKYFVKYFKILVKVGLGLYTRNVLGASIGKFARACEPLLLFSISYRSSFKIFSPHSFYKEDTDMSSDLIFKRLFAVSFALLVLFVWGCEDSSDSDSGPKTLIDLDSRRLEQAGEFEFFIDSFMKDEHIVLQDGELAAQELADFWADVAVRWGLRQKMADSEATDEAAENSEAEASASEDSAETADEIAETFWLQRSENYNDEGDATEYQITAAEGEKQFFVLDAQDWKDNLPDHFPVEWSDISAGELEVVVEAFLATQTAEGQFTSTASIELPAEFSTDVAAPLSFTRPTVGDSGTARVGQDIEFAVNVSDEESPESSVFEYLWEYQAPGAGDWTLGAQTEAFTLATQGFEASEDPYQVRVTVTDEDGNSAEATYRLTLQANHAPRPTFDEDGTTVAEDEWFHLADINTGTPQTFIVQGNDEDGGELTYRWEVNGVEQEGETGPEASLTLYSPLKDGQTQIGDDRHKVVVKVTVTDDMGEEAPISRTLYVNVVPTTTLEFDSGRSSSHEGGTFFMNRLDPSGDDYDFYIKNFELHVFAEDMDYDESNGWTTWEWKLNNRYLYPGEFAQTMMPDLYNSYFISVRYELLQEIEEEQNGADPIKLEFAITAIDEDGGRSRPVMRTCYLHLYREGEGANGED